MYASLKSIETCRTFEHNLYFMDNTHRIFFYYNYSRFIYIRVFKSYFAQANFIYRDSFMNGSESSLLCYWLRQANFLYGMIE